MAPEKRPVLRVPKEDGQEFLQRVKDEDRLDKDRFIESREDELLIPVIDGGNEFNVELDYREEKLTPYQRIKEAVDLPKNLEEQLPRKWEMIGDVLLLKMPEELTNHKEELGKIYADTLDMKTVLIQGGISGQKREPEVELIYGQETETVHKENGIKFKLDTAKLMFSSGNIDERIRMANVPVEGETIVDMFAGIGYFSLPMAVHSNPEKIYSLEINPVAYQYLNENVELNGVSDTVETWNGDNRDFSRDIEADRVVMGYLHETWEFLPKALDLLGETGHIHYHTRVKDKEFPERINQEVSQQISQELKIRDIRKIKSYAPHVFHAVADIELL